ncbi:MAG: zinc ribbon domain-containing protein [Nitrospiraceae bacterium]
MRCGIVFAKFKHASARASSLLKPDRNNTYRNSAPQEAWWLAFAKERILRVEDSINPFYFAGRVIVFVVLLVWGWKFMVTPLETNYTGESFLHLINLPFHEAGHLMFMPFGRFMMVLGGTLGQILMPVICLGTFLIKTRDAFGASVALWWTAENFMDIAPYVNDARALELMLLGGVTGREVEGHDWEYLLTKLGWLSYDQMLARGSYRVGIILMAIALLWGGILLAKQYRISKREA